MRRSRLRRTLKWKMVLVGCERLIGLRSTKNDSRMMSRCSRTAMYDWKVMLNGRKMTSKCLSMMPSG